MRMDINSTANKAEKLPRIGHNASSTGQRDLHPGDIIGAIASEFGIPGKAIGAIDIQPDYTFVDVAEQHARQVLQKSGGKYSLRGKTVVIKLA